MSNYDPLQAGDRSKSFSRRDDSLAADRRTEDENSIRESQEGANAAPSYGSPISEPYPDKNLRPSGWMLAPWDVQHIDEGNADEVREIDCSEYGEAFTPTGVARVRMAPNPQDRD
jgi:hypothetical protein